MQVSGYPAAGRALVSTDKVLGSADRPTNAITLDQLISFILSSLVASTLDGDEVNKVPSVAAVLLNGVSRLIYNAGNTTARTLSDKLQDFVSVTDYGAVADGVTDCTAAFVKAAETGKDIWVPPSLFSYYVKDGFTIGEQGGQRILGQSGLSRINIDGSFNMAATAVVTISPNSSEQNSGIDGITFIVAQPVITERSQLIKYPFIISAQSVSRLRFGHVKIQGAWNGMDLRGNCGGLMAERLELGCYNYGMLAGESLDWWNVGSITCWPYGCNYAVWSDGATIGVRLGRMDGFNCGALNSFEAQVIFEGGSGFGFGSINTLSLDASQGRMDFSNWKLTVGNAYATSSADTYGISATSGSLTIGNLWLIQWPNATLPLVQISGTARVKIAAVEASAGSAAVAIIEQSGGTLSLGNAEFDYGENLTRTAGYITCVGGRITIANPRFADIGTGSGPCITITNDDWHDVSIANTLDWTVQLPAKPSGGYVGTYIVQGAKQ